MARHQDSGATSVDGGAAPSCDTADARPADDADHLWKLAGESLGRSTSGLIRTAVLGIAGAVGCAALVLLLWVGLGPNEADPIAGARPLPPSAVVSEVGWTGDLDPRGFAELSAEGRDPNAVWTEAIEHYESLGWSTEAAVPQWSDPRNDGGDKSWVAVQSEHPEGPVLSLTLVTETETPGIYLEAG